MRVVWILFKPIIGLQNCRRPPIFQQTFHFLVTELILLTPSLLPANVTIVVSDTPFIPQYRCVGHGSHDRGAPKRGKY